jgi:DNA-binding NtrC family response regulator
MLSTKNFDVEVTTDPFEGLDKARKNPFDCILLDVKMPGLDGVALMDKIKKENPNVPIIFISGQSNIPIAVEAIKKGAYDFIEKPVDAERMFLTINHAIEKNLWARERNNLLTALDDRYRMIGESPVMKELFNKISFFSKSDAKVLITGETGTGKELVASALHYNGPRATQPYIKINCAAIPPELLESELFGHKKGRLPGRWKINPVKFNWPKAERFSWMKSVTWKFTCKPNYSKCWIPENLTCWAARKTRLPSAVLLRLPTRIWIN